MFDRHVSDLLAAYFDGILSPQQTEHVKAHLRRCERCRMELAQVEFAVASARQLPLIEAPSTVWTRIEAALDEPASAPSRAPALRFALALLVFAVVVTASFRLYLNNRPRWEVSRLEGSPTVGASSLTDSGQIAEGQWLQTDSASRASIKVGQIGTVEVAPNSRVRVAAARPNEHRLTLARGEISAVVNAPPRLFFVDTASSTAVDLGCAYKMRVDDDGNGLLQVTFGWVALEWAGKSSEVPAGAACHTRRSIGPGTPYFEDASQSLRQALDRFDFGSGGAPAIGTVLAESRVRDTLTLWHLLSRVQSAQRPEVYDRLVALASQPPDISRDKTLALDPDTLKRWGDQLVLKW